MKFTPKSDKEIEEDGLLPKGTYDYEIIEATDKTSKSGNDMIELKLLFFHGESGSRTIRDYLLEAMAGKLKHFCVSHRLIREYDNGTLRAEACVGLSGRALVGIEKDKSGKYPDKNTVLDYVVTKVTAPAAPNGITNEDVPF
jgi:hypothetical protein